MVRMAVLQYLAGRATTIPSASTPQPASTSEVEGFEGARGGSCNSSPRAAAQATSSSATPQVIDEREGVDTTWVALVRHDGEIKGIDI